MSNAISAQEMRYFFDNIGAEKQEIQQEVSRIVLKAETLPNRVKLITSILDSQDINKIQALFRCFAKNAKFEDFNERELLEHCLNKKLEKSLSAILPLSDFEKISAEYAGPSSKSALETPSA